MKAPQFIAAVIFAVVSLVFGVLIWGVMSASAGATTYPTTTTKVTYPSTTTTKVKPTTTTKVTYPSTTTSVKPTTTTHVTYPTTTTTKVKPTTTTSSTMKPTTTTSSTMATTTTSSTMASTTTTTANMTLLTLRATVINTHGGTATVDDFDLEAAGPVDISGITGAPAVTLASVPPGGYTLRDRILVSAALGYTSSGWSCIGSADQTPSSVVLDAGEDAVCAIVFADAPVPPGTLIVTKVLNGNAVGQQGEISIQANCGGFDFVPIVIPAGATGPVVTPFFGQGAGLSCTVNETETGAKAGITVTVAGSPQTVTIPSGAPVTATITDTVNTAEATTTTTAAGVTTTVAGGGTTVPGATTVPGETATTAAVLVPTAEQTPAVIETTPSATTSILPFTGYDPTRMLEAAGAALILGGAAVAVSRRRRNARK